MALYRWISTKVSSWELESSLETVLKNTGLAVDSEISNEYQLLAKDAEDSSIPYSQRVNVIVSWNDRLRGEIQIEVRSSEPLLRKGTRCELIANTIREAMPPSHHEASHAINNNQ